MISPDDARFIRDMVAHAQEAISIAGSISREDLTKDRLRELALIRLIEVIGEAANRVSPSAQSVLHTIPWAQIVRMRNRLIHGYDIVDQDILWRTVRDELPTLIKQLEQALDTVRPS